MNTLKSLLMHPKDKVPTSQKKDMYTTGSARQMDVAPHTWRNIKVARGKSQRALQINHICYT